MTVFSRPLLASLTGTLILLSACGEKSAEEQLREARASIESKQLKTALVQLKVTLKQNPDLADARYLFGKALLDNGEPALAAIELRKAIELGYSKDEATPALARALLASQPHQKLISELADVELNDPKAIADLKTSLAAAYALAGDGQRAQAAIDAATRALPDFPATLMLKARVAAQRHDYDSTLALLDKAVTVDPSNADAWVQKGESLYVIRQDAAAAGEAFRKALELNPTHMKARSGLITLAMGQKDWKTAGEQIAELRKTYPDHPMTAFYEAQLAFAEKKLKPALEKIELALKNMPENPQALQLAGAIQLANGSLIEAERSLSKALSLNPEQPSARRQLAQTLLRLGQPAKVLSTLQPLLKGDDDPTTHALAGEAYLAAGKVDQAIASFGKAVQLDPGNPANRTHLTLAKYRKSGASAAEATAAELQQIAASDPGTSANLALIDLLMRRQQLDRALKAIDLLEAKQPNGPIAPNLRGRIYALKKDDAKAKAGFEQAVARDPAYVPAVITLARYDLQAGKPAEARKRFEAILAVDPKNLEALLALAKIRTAEKAPKNEIAKILETAIKHNPAALEPRLLLVDLYLDKPDPKQALGVAQDTVAAFPNSADALDALGRAQQAAGEGQQALLSFKKLGSMEPQSTRAAVRIAGVHLADNNPTAAEQSLRQALAMYPDYLPIQQYLYTIAMADRRQRDAIVIAQTVQTQRPNDLVGYQMEASAQVSLRNMEGAITALRKGLKKNPRTDFAVKLHAALMSAKQAEAAGKMADAWLSERPKDVEFLAYIGNVTMVAGDYEKAEQYFRALLALQPNNVGALNNTAWVMARLKKKGAAPYAEKALKLQPDTPGLMDTLAQALAAEGQIDKALEIQKKAVSLDSKDQMLHLNLAKLQLQAGDKQGAAAELKALEKLGDKFPAQGEVTRMLKAL
ncbi:XrtA/PEP-CTERM system TPR-repeat protein PrsT [Roseateles violae]|uniref:PEP-CTERM system TPR-repeat protein PrsT n=1 Tax=Roseateles violae TaxID=3058042 RepID=A0ABT8DQ19_9BURK|nr:XrtA/PEP-CTERM system TPR-repeat protein PrsT [Pelomonas sp. PFR6]MDN3920439.1 PEP-CTERM system TPR-repeat protein PrsT [Pelomonas sp. PFR6]